MKKKEISELNDLTLPKKFKVNQIVRWITLFFGVMAIVYSFWMIINKIEADFPTWQKTVPFVIMFFALNSLIKNLFTINSIKFDEKGILLRHLAKKSIYIKWESIEKISFIARKSKAIKILYTNEQEKEETYYLKLYFSDMLSIMNYFFKYAENAVYDKYLRTIKPDFKKKKV